MNSAALLFCVLLVLENYESLADVPQNSEQSAIDQCYGLCNQIKPILDHNDHLTQLWNKSESRISSLEDQLKKMENQWPGSPSFQFKQKPELDKFIKIGSKYLYIEKVNKLNWFGAFGACREIGGQLVIIQDKKELNRINDLIAHNDTYWLGINDLAYEGVYRTWLSQENAPFVKWTLGEPNNEYDNQDCVVLFETTMWDLECVKNRYFICEAIIEE
ncbi:hypothetical protein KR067_009930 [Drosophila pandora]|nr:hypothetical protein KR067_009930 [Drosophila pandora]